MAPSNPSRFALGATALFSSLFLVLLIGIPWFPNVLASPLAGGFFTLGHLLVLLVHVFTVVAAWIYIGQRSE